MKVNVFDVGYGLRPAAASNGNCILDRLRQPTPNRPSISPAGGAPLVSCHQQL
jgi:hypothetical protein